MMDTRPGKKKVRKVIDVESLALMVADGFEDVMDRMATKNDIAKLEKRLILWKV